MTCVGFFVTRVMIQIQSGVVRPMKVKIVLCRKSDVDRFLRREVEGDGGDPLSKVQ